MSEDSVQVKIEADFGSFQGALKEAISALSSGVNDMKSSFAYLADSIRSTMLKSADATSSAAKMMSDGMKDSMTKMTAEADESTKKLANSVESAMNQAANAVGDVTDTIASGVQSSMQQAAQGTSQATQNMGNAVKKSVDETVGSLATVKSAIGAIGIGIVSVFGDAAKETIGYERSLLELSRTSGLTIEATSRLNFAGSQCGLTTVDLERNISTLSRNIVMLEKDTVSTANVFNRFGIDVHGADGKLLSADQIILKVADRFKSMPDGVEKTALAMQLFGSQGQSMIPMLNQGSTGIQKLGKDAEKLGLVFKDVEALQAYTMATKQYDATMKSLQLQLGTAVLPVLTAFSKAITNVLKTFNQLDPAFRKTIITTAGVVGGIAALTVGWGQAAVTIASFGGPFAKVGTMMSNMPNLLTGGINGLRSMVSGMADATIGITRYIVSGGLFTSASTAMNAVMGITASFLSGVKTAIVATSLAYNTGGVSSIVQYCASLISMSSVIAVARTALMLLYGTVTAGIAVVVALGLAWIGNFGNIQTATAGICDGISYGLSTFASGVKQIAGGIADVFANLAKAVSRAFIGDFQGAWDAAKGIGNGITDMAKGFGTAFQGVGQTAYAAVTNPGAALNFVKTAASAIGSGAKAMLGLGGNDADTGVGPGDTSSFSPNAAANIVKSGSGDTDYEAKKKLYEKDLALHNYTQAEKLQKYKEYLADVHKLDEEQQEYNKGLNELETGSRKEQLEMERLDLETRVAEGKASEAELLKQKIDMAAQALANEREGTIEYKRLLKEKVDAEKAYSDWQYQELQQRLERQKQHEDSLIALEEENIRHQKALGLITDEEETKKKEELDKRSYDNQLENINKLLQNKKDNNQTETKEYQDLLKQKEAIEEQWKLKTLQNANAVKEAQLKDTLEVKKNLTNSLNEAFQGIIKGTTSLRKALSNVFTSLGNTIFSQLSKSWNSALSQLSNRWASTITDRLFRNILNGQKKSSAEQIAVTQATEAAKQGLVEASTDTQVATQQAGAFAGVSAMFSSITSGFTALFTAMQSMISAIFAIPVIGPVLGIAAEVGIVAGLARLAGLKLPSFDVGTMRVPQDMLAMVHKNESIIPAPFADSARKVLSGELIPAGMLGGSTGGDVHLYYNPQVSLIDTRGARKFFDDHARLMADSLGKVNRNFYKPKSK